MRSHHATRGALLQIRNERAGSEQLTPIFRAKIGKIMLWSVVPQAEGVAVTLDAAQREHVRRSCRNSGLWVFAVILGVLLLFPPRDFVFYIVIMLAAVVGVLLMAGFRSNRWRKHAETVVADMPAPGTSASTRTGLTVGSITSPGRR